MSTNFAMDSSSCFPFRAQTQAHTYTVTDTTDHLTQALTTADVGNELCIHQQLTLLRFIDVDCVEEHETAWTSSNTAFKPTAHTQS